jgi:hypothetical protein
MTSKVETEITNKEIIQNAKTKKYCWIDKRRICDSNCIAYFPYYVQKCIIIYFLVEINNSLMSLKYREE